MTKQSRQWQKHIPHIETSPNCIRSSCAKVYYVSLRRLYPEQLCVEPSTNAYCQTSVRRNHNTKQGFPISNDDASTAMAKIHSTVAVVSPTRRAHAPDILYKQTRINNDSVAMDTPQSGVTEHIARNLAAHAPDNLHKQTRVSIKAQMQP